MTKSRSGHPEGPLEAVGMGWLEPHEVQQGEVKSLVPGEELLQSLMCGRSLESCGKHFVLMDAKSNMRQQLVLSTKKVNRILGFFRWSIVSWLKEVILSLYSAQLALPCLWCFPVGKRLEHTRDIALQSEMTEGLDQPSYEKRLRELRLFSPEKSRKLKYLLFYPYFIIYLCN